MPKHKPSKIYFPEPLKNAPGLLWEGWSHPEILTEYLIQEKEEDLNRLKALCLERGLAPDESMFMELALQLAREAYPERKTAGRNPVWNYLTKGALVVEVERHHCFKKKSVTWICDALSKGVRWNKFVNTRSLSDGLGPDPGEALRKVYTSFKNNDKAEISRKMFKLLQLQGTIPEWEKYVDELLANPILKKVGNKSN